MNTDHNCQQIGKRNENGCRCVNKRKPCLRYVACVNATLTSDTCHASCHVSHRITCIWLKSCKFLWPPTQIRPATSDSTIQTLYVANERNMQIKLYSRQCSEFHLFASAFAPLFTNAVFIFLYPLKCWWSLFQLNSEASRYVYIDRPRADHSSLFSGKLDTRPRYPSNSTRICCVVNLHRNLVRARSLCLVFAVFLYFSQHFHSFFFSRYFFVLGSMAFRPYFAWRRLVRSAAAFRMFCPCATVFFPFCNPRFRFWGICNRVCFALAL